MLDLTQSQEQLTALTKALMEISDQVREIRAHLGLTPHPPGQEEEMGRRVLHIDSLQEVIEQTATFTLHEPLIRVTRQLERELSREHDAVLLKGLAYRDDQSNTVFSLQSTTHLAYIERFGDEELAKAFTPLASPERWKIIRTLMNSPMTPKGLMDETGLSTGQLYHHLNLLLEHELISRTDGTYTITKAGISVSLWAAFAVTPLISSSRK